MKYLFAIALIISVVFCSCGDTDEDLPIDKGYEYFPTEVGKLLIYQADSTVWNKFKDTTYQVNFFVKEEIVDSYTDSQGRSAVRIDRSYSNDAKSWKKRDSWSAATDENFAERVEENARFVKLAFPLLVGKQWKGNAYLNESSDVLKPSDNWDWDYSVISRNETYTNGDISFTDVAEIQQKPMTSETLIQKTMGVEQYAKNVGLVSKELTILKTSQLDGDWPDKTEEGYIYRQRLIDHN